ncbi:MAG TPA: class I SAM-dependent methyltransferase [Vicinamibacterales bacterium]|nr:class I SAM-dependent methyltransferase [Vicinamibacterales bacterium]
MTAIRVDPEGEEIGLLLRSAPSLAGARVLEVGCGDGRLTRLYAHRAGSVLAIDPDPERIAAARALGGVSDDHVEYRAASVLDASIAAERPFNLAILSWSL